MVVEGLTIDSGRRAPPLLTAAERHRLLVECNATGRPFPADRCLHQLFAAQADRSPLAMAVVAGDDQLTYRCLDRWSDALVHRLRQRGVGFETPVAICCRRSPALVAAVLGVLKAGGAFVPLDVAGPPERLRRVLREAGAALAVADAAGRKALPRQAAGVVPAGGPADGAGRLGAPEPAGGADGLAYVIFTSGSTGRPKGVEVRHRGVVNLLDSICEQCGFTAGDRLLSVTALTFDISILELLLPLTLGGTVILATRSDVVDPARLMRAATRHRATAMQATPATWRSLVAAGWRGQAGFKALCGGEVLPPQLAAELGSGGVRLWNLYGPTETTIWSTAQPAAPAPGPIPIGRPLGNTRIYVLDRRGRLLPGGVAGELHIGGEGLARGYRGRPALTAERFVPDPFGPLAGSRLYRTGDRARLLPDGSLEYLGRLDQQVKIRGFRVEPGEVEAALEEHPAVLQAAVVPRQDLAAGRRLVAYAVPAAGTGPTAAELRAFLGERLPEYMVPSRVVLLAALPLTPSGKVDRKALPDPQGVRPELSTPFEPPRTAAERQVAAAWAAALAVDRVGRDDDFFALGGHSLAAVRVLARLRQLRGVELPLSRLLAAPTVAGVAAAIEAQEEEGGAVETTRVVVDAPQASAARFPLTGVQEAYWIGRGSGFELGRVVAHEYFEVDCLGLDAGRLARALGRLLERHGMLRVRVLGDGRQHLPPPPRPPLTVVDLGRLEPRAAGDRLAAIRDRLSHRPDGERWPLFDVQVTRIDGRRSRLHLSFDLLIGDAQSLRLLIGELVHLYRHGGGLPRLDLGFREYLLAARRAGDEVARRRARAYWRRRLQRLPPPPELPLAQAPGSVARPRFARRSVHLAPAAWRRLREAAARRRLAPVAVLLAAYAEVLAAWSRNSRFTLNLPVSERLPLHPQVDRVVGDFTSLIPLAIEPAAGDGFCRCARRLQERLWHDLDHRQPGGLDLLREVAREQGSGGQAPLPVVFTSLLGLPFREPADALTGLGQVVHRLTQTPQVWLDHLVSEQGGGLAVDWDAVEGLFPAGLLDDMVGAYRRLLERLAESEESWDQPPGGLLPAAQLARRAAVNATAVPLPEVRLEELVLAQAARQPDRVAVVSSRGTLTYGELARRVRRVASWLRSRGAAPGRPVAVVMEKGASQAVGVLGVLAAGAPYLPVDPGLPRARRHHLLAHGEVALALTQSRVEGRIEWPPGVERLAVDRLEGEAAAAAGGAAAGGAAAGPDDLAFVLYTSGSTGAPKGVMIAHRGVVNAVLDTNRRFGVGADDRVLALTALEHDMSVYDLCGLLAAGGRVVVPDAGAIRDPGAWLNWIAGERVSVWNSVPAFLEMLVEYAEGLPQAPRLPLRRVFLGGDWIPLPLLARLARLAPEAKVVSVGGPTETTLWNICYPVAAVDPSWRSVPYGRPIANTRYYVLDEALRDRPDWVPGELYSGGVGVAAGYWRDEALTRERFVTHPRTGERLYRSGDLGRYLPDGSIEFLGRADFQIKLLGRRIEPGEVEAVLRRHPAVRDAAVGAVAGASGVPRLVAWVVPEPEPAAAGSWPGNPELTDPAARAAFKLARPALRRLSPERGGTALARPPAEPARLHRYLARRSYRRFSQRPIPSARLGELLAALHQIDLEGWPLPKALYPSGGGLYPVQTYLAVAPGRVDGLAAGTYYYQPREHLLVLLDAAARCGPELHTAANRELVRGAAFTLVLVAEMAAVEPMYGNLSRDLCLLEAGYMGQLLMAAAPSCGIGLCPLGAMAWDELRRPLELGSSHQPLHALVGGAIEPAQGTLAALIAESAAVSSAPAGGFGELAAELRRFLAAELPAYMLPAQLVEIPRLPLGANGKVDRQALPAPGELAAAASPPAAPPREGLERTLAGLWCEALGVESIGRHDNFFDLGGTSLHVVQVHRRLRQALEREISIVEMFRCPNVASLAAHLDGGGGARAPAGGARERAEQRRRSAGRVRELLARAQHGSSEKV